MLSYEDVWVPSEDGLRRNIATLNERGLLIVGSVGRATVFGTLVNDSLLEINERGKSLFCHTTHHLMGCPEIWT